MHFLFRPKLIEEEALTTYLNRIAEENIVLPHELWRQLLPLGAHYPQASLASSIDHYPGSLLNISKLERMLLTIKIDLEKITYIPIYNKFGVDKQKISHSKILNGVIDRYRRYCPICLSERSVFKLIWQIKEINICLIHKILLLDRCWHCLRKIPLFPSNGINGLCPHCNYELSNALIQEDKCITQMRIVEDWQYMLNSKSIGLNVLDGVSKPAVYGIKTFIYFQVESRNYNKLRNVAPDCQEF